MTLTELSYYQKKFTPLAVIGVLVILIMYYVIKIALTVPTGPVTPGGPVIDNALGKLKAPIVRDASPSAGLTFTLDTLEGKPIDGPKVGTVFFIPPSNTRFGYKGTSEKMAETVGFDLKSPTTNRRLDNTTSTYEFKDEKQTLVVNLSTFNFNYQYTIQPTDTYFDTATVPSENEIRNRSTDYLRKMGRYPDELATGKTNIIYLAYNKDTKELSITKDPATANMVEVDFYRPDVTVNDTTYPIFAPKYFNSQNYVVMVFYADGYKVIRSQISFFEKSNEQKGTYPIKSGEQAFEELKKGKAIVVLRPTNTNNITIKEMAIGYYDPDVYQPYLQPVYVFLGDKDNNFIAYVPAVDESQMGN